MFNIFKSDYDLFKYALTKLHIGQLIRLSGTNQFGGTHTLETFIVKSVDGNEILTTTGLVFHYQNITHIGFTETSFSPEDLPHLGLTGQLETFPSEPE